MTATVIIPTTGAPELYAAIESVLNQTYDTTCYLVCDGPDFVYSVKIFIKQFEKHPNYKKIIVCNLPVNVAKALPKDVGPNGFYGHRVYAAFTHLVNTKYVLYLDQDCYLEPHHVETLVNRIEVDDLDWAYSLRNICDQDGVYICHDDCESLGPSWPIAGYPHVDTNCYCLKTEVATKIAQVWHGGWGQDRVFLNVLHNTFKKFDTTGRYSVNYRVASRADSVQDSFFIRGNEAMKQHMNGEYPWRKI